MNGKSTLEARLARLAASGTAGSEGRIVRGRSSEALLLQILDEIAETIMPRRVHLSTPPGAKLSLDIANGRLIRVAAAEGSPGFLGMDELTGTAFDPDDAEQAGALRSLFDTLLDGTDMLTFRPEVLEESFDPHHAGLSASALAEAWGIELETGGAPEAALAVDTFLSSIQNDISAWLMTVPGTPEVEAAGETDVVDELTAFAEARQESGEADRQAEIARDEPWSFLALHRAAEAPDVTVIASVDGVVLYVSIPRERLGSVADAWRAAVKS